MIGRGAIGKPWLIEEIASSAFKVKKSINNRMLSNIVNKHLRKIINFYGSEIGIRFFRKHLAGYLKHLEINTEIRRKLMTETSVSILSKKIDYHFQKVGEIN